MYDISKHSPNIKQNASPFLAHTIPCGCHLNVDSIRVDVFSSERAKYGCLCLCSVGVASLRRAALQGEIAVCRLYECVLAQAVEGVLEAVHRADVWVTVEPTCDSGRQRRCIFTSTSVTQHTSCYCLLNTC